MCQVRATKQLSAGMLQATFAATTRATVTVLLSPFIGQLFISQMSVYDVSPLHCHPHPLRLTARIRTDVYYRLTLYMQFEVFGNCAK